MNVSLFDISAQAGSGSGKAIFAGNLPMMQRKDLKSAQEKAERQQKAQGELAYWESRKTDLKGMECDTLEDVARKLNHFHAIEDEITSVKVRYNHEQMWHAMDEAKEVGEKIAEAAEDLEPKTGEERREDLAEEALGKDENKDGLPEGLEEMQEDLEEQTEGTEELTEELVESTEELAEEATEEAKEQAEEAVAQAEAKELAEEEVEQAEAKELAEGAAAQAEAKELAEGAITQADSFAITEEDESARGFASYRRAIEIMAARRKELDFYA